MSQKQIMKNWTKETHFKRAVQLQEKNPAVFWALKWLRKKYSMRKTVEYVKENMKNPTISASNVSKWKSDCESLIKDNNLFRDFMIAVGIDPDENNRMEINKQWSIYKKKTRKTQKEKDDKLKEEMDKAKILLEEMQQEWLSETKKWELHTKSRRQVDKINKAVQEWGLAKAFWVNELYDINGQLLAKGKEVILQKLHELDPKHMSELKALSDILDTAFKQNRLIEWKSTDNVAVWVHDIYDRIIANADKNGNWDTNAQ